MIRREVLEGVPAADLAQTIEDFESEGATVEKTETSPGVFRVIATWPEVTASSPDLQAMRTATRLSGLAGGMAARAFASGPPPKPDHLIVEGEQDTALVTTIQRALVAKGLGPFTAGRFDPVMTSIVKLFQAQHSDAAGNPLVVDGKVGSFTWDSLFGKAVAPVTAGGSPLLLQALGIAGAQVGQMESPIGSNRGVMVDQYLRAAGIDPDRTTAAQRPWCMAFVYWCFVQAGKAVQRQNPLPRTAGCVDHWERAASIAGATRIEAASAFSNPSLVRPGQIFILDFGGGHGHAGIVERLEGSGTLVTIEGNTDPKGSAQGVGVFRLTRRKLNDPTLRGLVDYSGA